MITNKATNKVLMLLACTLLAGFPVCVEVVVVGAAVGVVIVTEYVVIEAASTPAEARLEVNSVINDSEELSWTSSKASGSEVVAVDEST